MVILVTGAGGQLGQSLQKIAGNYPQVQFRFFSSAALDITDSSAVMAAFSEIHPDYCLNAAAYTAVDRAEAEAQIAETVNVQGARNLALACKEQDAVLLHVSTDFVFDGQKTFPYTEKDPTNPKSVYGNTKLRGEQAIAAILKTHFIVRTSWVYSEFGHNFLKTMLRLGHEKKALKVVCDQIGTPTYAEDLARALVHIAVSGSRNFGIYHYSSAGSCSWYEFAKEIFERSRQTVDLTPIPTKDYPTAAVRPSYSVLDKTKFTTAFGLVPVPWKEALANALQNPSAAG